MSFRCLNGNSFFLCVFFCVFHTTKQEDAPLNFFFSLSLSLFSIPSPLPALPAGATKVRKFFVLVIQLGKKGGGGEKEEDEEEEEEEKRRRRRRNRSRRRCRRSQAEKKKNIINGFFFFPSSSPSTVVCWRFMGNFALDAPCARTPSCYDGHQEEIVILIHF